MQRTPLLPLLCFFLFSCTTSNPDAIKSFGGITQTDNNGNILSDDPSDWRFDDEWNQDEENLFDHAMGLFCTDLPGSSIIAYPNPFGDIIRIAYNIPPDYLLSFRIVDRNFDIIHSTDSINQNIALQTNGYLATDTLRVYYKVFNATCVYRGHGDLMAQ